MHAVEAAVAPAFKWLLAGLATALPLLLVDGDVPSLFVAQLVALTAFALGLVSRIAPTSDVTWFASIRARRTSMFASAAAVVVVVTGVTGLVTLATTAALRFHPSTQFLQLISALDIAWVTAAVVVGVRWLASSRAGIIAGGVIGIVCVWSIWRYVDNVGFAPDGSWIVSRIALEQYVLPYDAMAALVAIGVVAGGIRRRQLRPQPSAQS
ncbi:MAG: hypothetical protein OEM97_03700 [Acidimicrobiia bacterium]|nr:hypothetical protein [Acidimicrobiia bacterium]